MATKHYICVDEIDGDIYHRYKVDGETRIDRIPSFPMTMYNPMEGGRKKDIFGVPVEPRVYGNAKILRNALYYMDEQKTKRPHGMERVETQFIVSEYPEQVRYASKDIVTAYFDIETEVDDKFPSAQLSEQRIISISLVMSTGEIYLFSLFNEDITDVYPSLKQFYCLEEEELIETFIKQLGRIQPDIISGWNSKGFDVTYIINRLYRINRPDLAYKLSPLHWAVPEDYDHSKLIKKRYNKESDEFYYEIKGMVHIDYMELYKKYSRTKLPRYSLQVAVETELKESKVDYAPYKSLKELYENDKRLFLKYSVHDSVLLKKMNDKLKLMDLAVIVAYMTKSNLEDIFMVTRVWDNFIYDMLNKEGIIIPPKVKKEKRSYEGGYVKEPLKGKHKYVTSFDLTSEYPMLIDMYAISPENLVNTALQPQEIEQMKDDFIHLRENDMILEARARDLAITANGTMYKRNKDAILPRSVRTVFALRDKNKKLSKSYAKKAEAAKAELIKRGIKLE